MLVFIEGRGGRGKETEEEKGGADAGGGIGESGFETGGEEGEVRGWGAGEREGHG